MSRSGSHSRRAQGLARQSSGAGDPDAERVYDVCAGGVVVRPSQSNWDAALIFAGHPARWCLPKGHVEAGESVEVGALREVREETGLTCATVTYLSKIRYRFQARHKLHFKTVHFYLMLYQSGDVSAHDHEVEHARWFPLPEAETIIHFANQQRIVHQAMAHIEAHGLTADLHA